MADRKKIIRFVQEFEFLRELGQGACGQTVLLRDPIIGQTVVCKKYAPIQEERRAELYNNFVREIGILYTLNHVNVVRVFSYHLFPDQTAGFILMEHVDGLDIEEYLVVHPDKIDQIFLQIIEGFAHLEQNDILHRDIRPKNILVSSDGVTKIIDFGFGKRVVSQGDFDKSISLNWWCEPPLDFVNRTYDFSTEVYFVGKLFEKIILESDIEQFAYKTLLSKMCMQERASRIPTFNKIRQEILSGAFTGINFSNFERDVYQEFASAVKTATSKIERGTKYFNDADEILRKLEGVHRRVMLESHVPSNNLVLRCLLNGAYFYSKSSYISVETLRDFIELMRGSSKEKREIILSNLFTRLDTVTRYDDTPPPPTGDFDDDIPF